MAATVFSVGMELPGGVAEEIPLRSDRSLFDADIIVFRPTLHPYITLESYKGRPLVSEGDSVALARDFDHWRSEIKSAVESGKVVFVYLYQPEERYYYTGSQAFSGTGRGRVTTNHVGIKSSYECLPFKFEELTPRGGSTISPLGPLGALSAYWTEFSASSKYHVHFAAGSMTPLLGTKNRERVVGGLLRTKGGGALVFLPPVDWDEESLTYTRADRLYWRKDAQILGNRLVASLVATSGAIRRDARRSPPPAWVQGPRYTLAAETAIKSRLAHIEAEQAELNVKRTQLEQELVTEQALYGLLYETGPALEVAILVALRTLGFSANGHKASGSEFDAVFTATEGRFLGEAEGKDSKSINIDKMSQLERNLQEDFAREEVSDYAKGVLFGNAHRLLPLEERPAFFTEKCILAAKRLRIALVRTPDLFLAARHAAASGDIAYAAACRRALLETEGEEVRFPDVGES